MHKLKRSLAALLCVLTLFGVGAKDVGYAATAGITASITTQKVSATYTYGKAGHRLQVKIYFVEKHSTTEQVYEDIIAQTVNGNNTYVCKVKYADVGYNFIEMSAFGYVDGVSSAGIYGLKP